MYITITIITSLLILHEFVLVCSDVPSQITMNLQLQLFSDFW